MKMKTKIILGAILPVALFAFGALSAQAQTNSCPSLAPYMCNNGTCVNDTSLCSRTSMGGLSTSNPSTVSGTSGTQAPADLSTANLSEKCTGNLRIDLQATQACAALAEKQGRELGYDITCTTEKRTDVLAKNAVPIGERDAYFATCRINGSPDGYDPVSLVGYSGSGAGTTLYDNFLGTTQAYGSGYNVNSMWYSLPCDLANAAEGKSGVLQGAVTCTKGAQQYFGSSNPSTWRVDTAISKRTGTGTSGTSGSSQLKTSSVIPTTTLGLQIQNMISLLNRMLEQARGAYGAYTQNNSQTDPATTQGKTSTTVESTATTTTTTSGKQSSPLHPLICSPSTQTVGKYSVAYLTVADSSNPNFDWTAIYNWSAPGSTKESGAGWNFGTSYTSAGTYKITVSGVGQTATCEVKVY